MKKIIICSIFLLTMYNIFSLVAKNDDNDIGLNEKSGTFGLSPYLRQSYIMFFTSVGSPTTFLWDPSQNRHTPYPSYGETGGRVKMYFDIKELQGFYFLGDFILSRNSLSRSPGGDLSWWNDFVPYFGETHIGYKHKYFFVNFGFQRLVSSDAIYHHLMLDDYSGSLFGLRLSSMLGRYVDIDLLYTIVRPHEGPWYSGDTIITPPETVDDETLYYAYYGKSIYSHKLNIRPLPWIRFGIQEVAYIIGENINPHYMNPFYSYIAAQALASDPVVTKEGARYNDHALNALTGIDFNIGFNGWRIYGEFFVDDFNGEYFIFREGSHPDKFGFTLGGELRGYIFTKYYQFTPTVEFILENFYINFEYAITSKYCYSRDSNFNYEYVRSEYKYLYDANNPPSSGTVKEVNRIGNFLGYMYGPNADSIDIAIGWRSDLKNVKEYTAGYAADEYFHSLKKKKIPERLVKFQIHFRQYRLGDERNVIMPYYWNEHPSYDLTTGDEKDEYGTSRGTEFLTHVLEIGDILEFSVYSDIVRLGRFVLGMETEFHFEWRTYYPFTYAQWTDFYFKWDYGIILSW